ncbi:MAG: hypothetical protein IT301_06295 [Dehalococcoidia bacterium]|nr:hypothetical protein [Dehalococcoidia bacterium]
MKFLAFFMMLILGLAAAVATAAEPSAVLSFSNTAAVDGHYVEFSISVSNSGDADSGSQTVQSTLPAGADWAIVEDTIGCSLAPSLLQGRTKLDCDPFIVPKRDLDGVDTDGLKFVTIGGVVDQCGDISNAALFNLATIRSTTVNIPCPATPTPIPTATAPPITATTGPVELPTSTPTATIAPAKTAVPGASTTPRPPNTGTGPADQRAVRDDRLSAALVFLIALTAGVALLAVPLSYTRSRRR